MISSIFTHNDAIGDGDDDFIHPCNDYDDDDDNDDAATDDDDDDDDDDDVNWSMDNVDKG